MLGNIVTVTRQLILRRPCPLLLLLLLLRFEPCTETQESQWHVYIETKSTQDLLFFACELHTYLKSEGLLMHHWLSSSSF